MMPFFLAIVFRCLVLFAGMPTNLLPAPLPFAITATAAATQTTTATHPSTTSAAPVKLLFRMYKPGKKPLLLVFSEALAGGIVSVFTPYVFAFVPMTMSTLMFRSKGSGRKNTLLFSGFLVLIFAILGGLISLLTRTTNVASLSHHWLFNLFFFRLLAGLGLSLLGAFDISLPLSLIRATQGKATPGSLKGLFFMALTLPVVTFSSTMPMAGLVLVLSGKGGTWGPLVGMLGYALGLTIPFLSPRFINLMPATALNSIKVFMGFLALLLGIKFFSNADIAQGWHILDREIFLLICILFSVMLGLHMLGFIKLSNDYQPPANHYGQQHVPLGRLMIAFFSFVMFLYMLPGLWGAPLHGINFFLPPATTGG